MAEGLDFRSLAAKCRGLASRATDKPTIAALLDVAAHYEGEAMRNELDRHPPTASPTR
jgi:hypothetical protein